MNLGKVSDQSKKQNSVRQSFDFKLNNLTSSLAVGSQKKAVVINQFKTSKDSFNVKTTLNTIENEVKRKLQRNKSNINTNSDANRESRQNSENHKKATIKVSFVDKKDSYKKLSASKQSTKPANFTNLKASKALSNMSSPGSKSNLFSNKKSNFHKDDSGNPVKQFDRKPTNPNPGFKQKIIRQASASVVGTNMMKRMLLDRSEENIQNHNHMNKYIDNQIILESDSKDFIEEDEIKKRVGIAPVNTYLVTNFNQTYKGKTINKIQSSSRLDDYKNIKDKQSNSSTKYPTIRSNHSPSTTDRKQAGSKNKIIVLASSKKIPSCPVTTTNKNEKSPPKTQSKKYYNILRQCDCFHL